MSPDLYPEEGEKIRFNAEDGGKSMVKPRSLNIFGKIRGMDMNYYLKDEARARKVKVKLDDGMQSVKLSNSSYQLKSSQRMPEN